MAGLVLSKLPLLDLVFIAIIRHLNILTFPHLIEHLRLLHQQYDTFRSRRRVDVP